MLGGPKFEKCHFFLRKKKLCKIVRFKSLKKIFRFEAEKGSEKLFSGPTFFSLRGISMAFEKACPKDWPLSRNTFFRENNRKFLGGRDLGEKKIFLVDIFFSGSLYEKGLR